MRPLGILAAGLAVTAAAILFVRLAPRPPYPLINDGSVSLFGQDLRDELAFRVGTAGVYGLALRAKTPGAAPGTIAVEVRDEERTLLPETVFPIPGDPHLGERPLLAGGAPVVLSLSAGRRYSCRLRAASPGLGIDALVVRPGDGGAPIVVEAEDGLLTGALVAVDAEASGGAFAMTLAPGSGVESLTETFRAEADGLDGLIVNLPAAPRDEKVRVFVRRIRTGEVLFDETMPARTLAKTSPYLLVSFPRVSKSSGESFELGLEQPGSHPVAVTLSEPGAYGAGRLVYRNQRLASDLVFAPRYSTPWDVIAWLALPLVVVLVAFGFRDPRAGRFALALMLPLLSLVAIAYWQREYQFMSGYEWMPDGYDTFATTLRHALVSPSQATFGALRSFLAEYPHAHSPLVPFCVALFMGFTGDVVRAYLLVTLLFSSAAGWLALRLFERLPGASWPGAWAATCLSLTHFLFLRSAVRTSTDPAGYCFVVLGLLLALEFLKDPAMPRLVALIAVLALGLFVRPTNLPLSVAAGGALFLANRERWARALAVTVIPPAVFLLTIRIAGFWGSFALAHSKALGFSEARTGPRLAVCLFLLVQLLWLPVLLARQGEPDVRGRYAILLGGLWFTGTLGFLLLSGAPYWNRHFLLALPGLLILVVPAASRLLETRPRLGAVWFASHVAFNLGLIAFNLHRGVGLGPKYLLN